MTTEIAALRASTPDTNDPLVWLATYYAILPVGLQYRISYEKSATLMKSDLCRLLPTPMGRLNVLEAIRQLAGSG
jgi:hypothetical protein